MSMPVVYPVDVRFDTMDLVPTSLLDDSRYREVSDGIEDAGGTGFSLTDLALKVKRLPGEV